MNELWGVTDPEGFEIINGRIPRRIHSMILLLESGKREGVAEARLKEVDFGGMSQHSFLSLSRLLPVCHKVTSPCHALPATWFSLTMALESRSQGFQTEISKL